MLAPLALPEAPLSSAGGQGFGSGPRLATFSHQ